MTKNEQIQEMAKDVTDIHRFFLEDDDYECLDEYIAVRLFAKGYRKVERGEWVLIGNGNGRAIHWKCSVCGYETLDAANGDTDFCPNCGADMRKEQNNDGE